MKNKILQIGAVACFGLATLGVAIAHVTLLPLGLALYVVSELI